MEYVDLDAFFRDGYAVIRVINPRESARYTAIAGGLQG